MTLQKPPFHKGVQEYLGPTRYTIATCRGREGARLGPVPRGHETPAKQSRGPEEHPHEADRLVRKYKGETGTLRASLQHERAAVELKIGRTSPTFVRLLLGLG